jgi:hypothetical protein
LVSQQLNELVTDHRKPVGKREITKRPLSGAQANQNLRGGIGWDTQNANFEPEVAAGRELLHRAN